MLDIIHTDRRLTCFIRGINEGRQSAREVDLYLEKSTGLPITGGIVKFSAQEILGPTISVSAAA